MGAESLEAAGLGRFTLHVESKRKGESELSRFSIFLVGGKGEKSSAVIEGLQSTGVPYLGISGWIDCEYYESAEFPGGREVSLPEEGLDKPLFMLLGSAVPEGGSLMVAYEMYYGKSKLHAETSHMLNSGAPPEQTPLGKLLAEAGFGKKLRDWYFPEGGAEGHMKLQGFRE